jgi:hypothetical protein
VTLNTKHGERIDLVDFYAQVRGRPYHQALEDLQFLRLAEPDNNRTAPGSKGFDTADGLLEFLKRSQPDYDHVKSWIWHGEDGEAQKIVHRFTLRLSPPADREPVLIFLTYLYRGRWYRVKPSKAKDAPPYNWAKARNSPRIVIARDEEEADHIHGFGYSAVALSSVGLWESAYAPLFHGKDVVLVVEPGASEADDISRAMLDLSKIAGSFRVLPFQRSSSMRMTGELLDVLVQSADDLLRPWKAPKCLLRSFELIPEFNGEEMLPESLRYYLEEQAEDLQVPLSSLAAPTLAGLSLLVGKKLVVQPKRRSPGYRVAAPLWCLLVADPGQKKSQVLKVALGPLLAIEKKLSEANFILQAERTAEMKDLLSRERELEGMLSQARKSSDQDGKEAIVRDLTRLELQKSELAAKGTRQHLVREATPEKLLEILVQNPNGVMQLSDEVPGWWRSLSTNHVDMRKLFLEGWGGFDIHIQRKGYALKGSSILSVVGGAQCDWVQNAIADIKAGKDNDGLLNRFSLLINHEPPLELWRYVDNQKNEKARDLYFGIFEAFDEMTGTEILDNPNKGTVNAICFSAEAEKIFINWITAKENQIRQEGFPRALASHLSKYTSLFASLSLIFHLIFHFEGCGFDPTEIGVEATMLAKRWCDYLSAHAERTFLGKKSHPLAVRTLAKLILTGKLKDRTTTADILKGSHTHIPNEKALQQALKYLADRNIIRVESNQSTEIIRVNPLTLKEVQSNIQRGLDAEVVSRRM